MNNYNAIDKLNFVKCNANRWDIHPDRSNLNLIFLDKNASTFQCTWMAFELFERTPNGHLQIGWIISADIDWLQIIRFGFGFVFDMGLTIPLCTMSANNCIKCARQSINWLFIKKPAIHPIWMLDFDGKRNIMPANTWIDWLCAYEFQ